MSHATWSIAQANGRNALGLLKLTVPCAATAAARTFSVDSGDALRIMCVNMAARLSAIGAGWSVVVLTAACGGNPAPAPNPSASAAPSSTAPMKITDPYSPTIDPTAFSATIDNPYLPMVPGTRTIYEAHTPDGLQQTTTEVTRDTKMIKIGRASCREREEQSGVAR